MNDRASLIPPSTEHCERVGGNIALLFDNSRITDETPPAGARGKDVLLTIHHNLPDDAGPKIAVGGGWATHAGILDDRLKGAKPRPFFSTHAREMKEFEQGLAEARV